MYNVITDDGYHLAVILAILTTICYNLYIFLSGSSLWYYGRVSWALTRGPPLQQLNRAWYYRYNKKVKFMSTKKNVYKIFTRIFYTLNWCDFYYLPILANFEWIYRIFNELMIKAFGVSLGAFLLQKRVLCEKLPCPAE